MRTFFAEKQIIVFSVLALVGCLFLAGCVNDDDGDGINRGGTMIIEIAVCSSTLLYVGDTLYKKLRRKFTNNKNQFRGREALHKRT